METNKAPSRRLKSTYKPSPVVLAASAPLPPGWTEHKAPTGHAYYYNAETKESTYARPVVKPAVASAPAPAISPSPNPLTHLAYPSNPSVAKPYPLPLNQHGQTRPRAGHGDRGGFQGRPRPQPKDKPIRKEAIPGFEPWILVYTKYSRRFVYNSAKNASFWRIPDKLMPGILELDKARVRDKAADEKQPEQRVEERKQPLVAEAAADSAEDPGSEYEEVEVEVTDDEGGDDLDGEHRSKRQRTNQDENNETAPVEFTEADIAAQLKMMGEEYGLEPGDYNDGNRENWAEGAEGVDFSEEDAMSLFRDLLNDLDINPYSSWDKLLEEGQIVDDARYTALNTTRARKECWDGWSRDKIAALKEQRAKQESKDPRIAYLALLHDKATPKLYWPEFRRKYKKEEPMRDLKLSDRDREKAYREYINRLKLPQATLRSDLTALLKAQPAHLLHRHSLTHGLPTQILTDMRYISLESRVRDPLIEAYVQSLPPPPPEDASAETDEVRRKECEARERRERALEQRNRVIEEQKRQRERNVAASKARLREGEREIAMAMQVSKRGLRSQLTRDQFEAQDEPSAADVA